MKIFKIMAFLGIVLILGAIDASDSGVIGSFELVRQMLIGLLVTWTGLFLSKHTEKKPVKKQRRAEIVSIEQLYRAG